MYAFVGIFGQLVVVVPSLDVVITRVGVSTYFDPANAFATVAGEMNPDFRELVGRILATVEGSGVQLPVPPYGDPPVAAPTAAELRGFIDSDLMWQNLSGGGPGLRSVGLRRPSRTQGGEGLVGPAHVGARSRPAL